MHMHSSSQLATLSTKDEADNYDELKVVEAP